MLRKTLLLLTTWMLATGALATCLAWSQELRPSSAQNIVDTLQTLNPPSSVASSPSGCGTQVQTQGCSAILESFCNDLISPSHQGNVDINVQGKPISIRLGSAKNGQSEAFYAFEKAKIDHQHELPGDLYKKLNQRGYFSRLQKVLQNDFHGKPNKLQALNQNRELSELSLIWNESFEETAIAIVEKQHPGFSAMSEPPAAWEGDLAATKNQMDAWIAKTIWLKTPAWQKAIKEFAYVKDQYIQELKEDPKLSPTIKDDWISRIKSVELAEPGSDPESTGGPGCAIDVVNAFYNPYSNKIYVCAGYFNTSELKSLFGHELSHSLGVFRSAVIFKQNSELSKRLNQMTTQVCKNPPVQKCPAEWSQLKSDMRGLAALLGKFQPQVPGFFSCLQYKDLKKEPSPEFVKNIAESVAIQEAGTLSTNDGFLSLVSRDLVSKNGGKSPNPKYLNPCGIQVTNEVNFQPIDHMKTFFTLEYACNTEGANETARISNAIESAKKLQAIIAEKTVPMGGRYSSNEIMTKHGFSESPEERFADAMGSKVFARILRSIPSAEDRKKAFLANTAEKCTPRSLASEHPDEAQAIFVNSLETHSSGRQRRYELMNEPIRSALGCTKDFSSEDCSL